MRGGGRRLLVGNVLLPGARWDVCWCAYVFVDRGGGWQGSKWVTGIGSAFRMVQFSCHPFLVFVPLTAGEEGEATLRVSVRCAPACPNCCQASLVYPPCAVSSSYLSSAVSPLSRGLAPCLWLLITCACVRVCVCLCGCTCALVCTGPRMNCSRTMTVPLARLRNGGWRHPTCPTKGRPWTTSSPTQGPAFPP